MTIFNYFPTFPLFLNLLIFHTFPNFSFHITLIGPIFYMSLFSPFPWPSKFSFTFLFPLVILIVQYSLYSLIFSEGYRRYLALGFTSFVRTYVRMCVSVFAFLFFCLNDQAYNCLIHLNKRGISMSHHAHHASCIMHHASFITQRIQP